MPDRETLVGLVVRVDITLVQFGKSGQYGSLEAGGGGGGGEVVDPLKFHILHNCRKFKFVAHFNL